MRECLRRGLILVTVFYITTCVCTRERQRERERENNEGV